MSDLIEKLCRESSWNGSGSSVCEEAAIEITRLRDKIGEKDDLIEKLERNAEIVSEEFESDCWRALRRLLEITAFDFIGGEGITAEEAFEHISEYINHGDADYTRLTAENASLREAVRPFCFDVPDDVSLGEDCGVTVSRTLADVLEGIKPSDFRRARAALEGK